MDNDTEISPVTQKIAYLKMPTIAAVISLIGVVILTVTNNPGSGGPVVILLFLLLVFLGSLSIVVIVLQLLVRFIGKAEISLVRLLYTSVAAASGIVFLIGLQTLRQLQLVDVILVVFFEVLLNFYLLRRF